MTAYEESLFVAERECNEADKYYYCGFRNIIGLNCEKNKERARKEYLLGAQLDSAKCLYALAVLALKNQPAEAKRLFAKAFDGLLAEAECGDVFSQRMVSCYYYFGDRGIKKDFNLAISWLKKAAEGGNYEAQFDLGLCYQQGDGVEYDLALARYWYAKAANAGYQKAAIALTRLNKED